MQNKILIIDADPKDRQKLEEILQEVVQNGGEILFADKREEGLALLSKEHPKLVFLDTNLVGENENEWVKEGVHIVVMRRSDEKEQRSEDFVLKPLQRRQILEKCQTVLKRERVPPLPPM